MKIAVLALECLFDTGLTSVLDVFATANALSQAAMGGVTQFDVTTVGVRRKVRSAQGLTIPITLVTDNLAPDWLIVPALKTVTPDTLLPLQRADVRDAVTLIGKFSVNGIRIAAACIGTFIVAESGILAGLEATTTWSVSPLFRQRFPTVKLDETRMLVPTEVGVTAGSAMGHLDLALWLVRQASPQLAELVSRYLLADIRSSQAAYIVPNHLAQSDPLVLRFEEWARSHLREGFSLQDAACALATSPRSLQRRCQAVLGKSPLAYFQDLRVERARSLIQGSREALDQIAADVGYIDGATLRTLLRQRLGRGVRELRAELR
ncbi:GlxA family transcriptional regulator [Novosphingobium sp. JCM 18896]|uniref:GlxA family transcriptional regulator n=1 Tax=Novosphingobium sp. JCM 18896 TaxID=2989731 RepID=UPI002222C251|nr:helix-turn-helix domain-containing protein [Novosphingobium sp. JCM 18896]MCW1430657.1 helix-turn-helix domain-containing protein [Novosphingobium sp. JCM 18896]